MAEITRWIYSAANQRESYKYYLVLLCLSVAISCLVLFCFLAWASGKCSVYASFNGHTGIRQTWDSDCGFWRWFWKKISIYKMLILFYIVELCPLETEASQVIVFFFLFLISNSSLWTGSTLNQGNHRQVISAVVFQDKLLSIVCFGIFIY